MKSVIFGAALMATALTSSFASAAVVVSYSFDGLTLPATAGTTPPTPSAGSYAADVGTGAFTGLHASAATVWSTPAGNGTAKTVSSNNWGVGDYYQFSANLTGVTGVQVQYDQTGSGTGPRDFKVQYSTDGTTFNDLAGGAYALTLVTFNAGTAVTTTPPRFLFDFSAITALNNNANAAFRIVDTSTVSINAGAIGTAGTGRVDTILIGNNLAVSPEPTTLAALAGGVMMIARRRKA